MANVSMYGSKLENDIAYQMFGSAPVEELNLEQINTGIAECKAMLDHFIQLKNAEEIAFWRGALQNAKLYKRSIVNS